ncbi:MAG: hypothetical protein H6834_16585 [Planctomycetes bacterium]|nr:hypothetical protein [Planctomycetota bacterium]
MDDSTDTMVKRRRKLIDPKAQLRVCALFSMIGIVMAALHAVILYAMLHGVANTLPNDALLLAEESWRLTWTSFAIAVVLVVPITFFVGIQVTFRIAGPLHRFREYLARLVAGEATEPCQIRSGDMLQDFCELLNSATAPRRTRQGVGTEERTPVEVG